MTCENDTMTPRERFLAMMRYEPIDRLPMMAVEPFETAAIQRWRREGLPEDAQIEDFLGMSRLVHVPMSWGAIPAFEHRVIWEDEEYIVETTSMNATVQRRKDNPTMFYGHIDHPVKTLDDWKEYKRHFQASSPGRLPNGWEETVVPRLNASRDPVGVCFFPFFFRLGFYSMGMEGFLMAFHDQPDLIHDMFSHWSNFAIENVRPVLETVKLDFAMFAEDLAGKNGPLISPKTYEEFWYPYQDPIIQMLLDHDVPVICQWSAGQFENLLPGMMEHGFNCTWPLEAIAGMDAPTLRNRYGRGLLMAGNISKESLIAGPDAIDREIERLMPLIHDGGFLPTLDDMGTPDAPFSHYQYMIQRLQSIRLG